MSDLIGVIFTGLIGIITALGGIQFQRGRRTEKAQVDLVAAFALMQKQVNWLRKRDIANTQHIYHLEHSMASAGIPIPVRPKELDETGPMPMLMKEAEE